MPQTVKNKIETVFWDEEGNPKNISEQTAVVFMGISASGYGTRRCGPNPGLRGSTFGISPCIAPEDFEVKSKDQLPD
ncbi:hypothetical protein A2Z22_04880 [Candidatus Woesebacteria bacterium RBG_16_34_12]|uniref:Uncharacterized protein n=1 Tax=Candidatus Woesebacteria bacterium RBG_16_34_12 TaxID=1802480 RepID=A0A1F7XAE9_9BACT|nr:MAG: hypothetical protein A2Z22_04880 [Candidatus Woesebacteria bacterium RBG_16_34_12]